MATDAFEEFIDKGIRKCERRGYYPTTFKEMRRSKGTIRAMEELVRSGELQSGFVKLKKMNMLEWSIEAAILKYPRRFTEDARRCAKFRLSVINDPVLRSIR